MRKHAEKYIKIGSEIKRIRTTKNISQEELSSMVGISKSYISKIEAPNCDKAFSLEVLFDIAQALDVSVTDLLKDV